MKQAIVRIYTNNHEELDNLSAEARIICANLSAACDAGDCTLDCDTEILPREVDSARLVARFMCEKSTDDCITTIRLAASGLDDLSDTYPDIGATTKMLPLYPGEPSEFIYIDKTGS